MDEFDVQVAEYFLSIAERDDAEVVTASKFNISLETLDYIMQVYAVDTL